MGVFGDLKVRIDPWEIEYGAELPLTAEDIDTGEQVDCAVEVAAEAWAPVTPRGDGARDLIFVDGIRRLELRLQLSDRGTLRHGALGSFATGAAWTRPGNAAMVREEVVRLAIASGGLSLPGPLRVTPALVYGPRSTPRTEPDAPLRSLHEAMRSQEEKLAWELSRGETLVVVDGPLTFAEPERNGAVGFIKRLFKLYLESQQLHTVEQLALGQRSPLFALSNSRRFDRYSWYLRLAQRPIGCAELAGVVRLEVASAVGQEAAQHLADLTARLLPSFAPSRPRDPRAPQNLLPIGAIEATLRRRLGDARLVRRHLEAFIIQENTHG